MMGDDIKVVASKLGEIAKRPMTPQQVGFRITGGKGFQFTFENGYTVSVQFGPANYCDHYDRDIMADAEACGREGSLTAECAVWPQEGQMLEYGEWGDAVSNRSTPAEVLELLVWAAAQERKEHDDG